MGGQVGGGRAGRQAGRGLSCILPIGRHLFQQGSGERTDPVTLAHALPTPKPVSVWERHLLGTAYSVPYTAAGHTYMTHWCSHAQADRHRHITEKPLAAWSTVRFRASRAATAGLHSSRSRCGLRCRLSLHGCSRARQAVSPPPQPMNKKRSPAPTSVPLPSSSRSTSDRSSATASVWLQSAVRQQCVYGSSAVT